MEFLSLRSLWAWLSGARTLRVEQTDAPLSEPPGPSEPLSKPRKPPQRSRLLGPQQRKRRPLYPGLTTRRRGDTKRK